MELSFASSSLLNKRKVEECYMLGNFGSLAACLGRRLSHCPGPSMLAARRNRPHRGHVASELLAPDCS